MLAWSVDEAEHSIRRSHALNNVTAVVAAADTGSLDQPKKKRIDIRSRKYKNILHLSKAASSPGQRRIPEYFKFLNEIQILAARNSQQLYMKFMRIYQPKQQNPQIQVTC